MEVPWKVAVGPGGSFREPFPMYKGRGFSARKSKRARQLATKNENIANVAVAHVLGTLFWVLHIKPMVFDDFRVPKGTPAGEHVGPRWHLAVRGCPTSRVHSTNPRVGRAGDPSPRSQGKIWERGKREDVD